MSARKKRRPFPSAVLPHASSSLLLEARGIRRVAASTGGAIDDGESPGELFPFDQMARVSCSAGPPLEAKRGGEFVVSLRDGRELRLSLGLVPRMRFVSWHRRFCELFAVRRLERLYAGAPSDLCGEIAHILQAICPYQGDAGVTYAGLLRACGDAGSAAASRMGALARFALGDPNADAETLLQKVFWNLQPEPDGVWISAPYFQQKYEELLEDVRGRDPVPVLRGPMAVVASGALAGDRFACLYHNRLEVHPDEDAADMGLRVLCSVLFCDVLACELGEGGFSLSLQCGRRLAFAFPAGDRGDCWRAALEFGLAAGGQTLCGQPPKSGTAASGSPAADREVAGAVAAKRRPAGGRPAAGREEHRWHPPGQLVRLASRQNVREWALAPRAAGGAPILYGVLGVQDERTGRLMPRFCAAFEDRLEWWPSPVDAVGGARPEDCVRAHGLLGCETVGDGFLLTTIAGRTIALFAPDAAREGSGWAEAFEVMLTQALDCA